MTCAKSAVCASPGCVFQENTLVEKQMASHRFLLAVFGARGTVHR